MTLPIDPIVRDSPATEVPGRDPVATSAQRIWLDHRDWLESVGTMGARAELDGAELRQIQLPGATLRDATIRRSDLRGANLCGADLQSADLTGTDFTHADLSDANLSDAILRDVRFHECLLKNTCFDRAHGMVPSQLAGSVLTNATLPVLTNVSEPLEAARQDASASMAVLLSVVILCGYCLLTVATTEDSRLITNSATFPLPIIAAEVHIVGFYLAAPLLLLVQYLYCQMCLQRLWQDLSRLPAYFEDGMSLDVKVRQSIIAGIVAEEVPRLHETRSPMSRWERRAATVLIWWLAPATIALIWGRYLVRHDWYSTAWHMVLVAVSITMAIIFRRLAWCALRRETLQARQPARVKGRIAYVLTFVSVFGIVTGLSIRAIEAPPVLCHWIDFGCRVAADLDNLEVSIRPPNWTSSSTQFDLVRGARLTEADLRWSRAEHAFLVNGDLRGANLVGSDLTRADLRGAQLKSANLESVQAFEAVLAFAVLPLAKLTAANLPFADFHSANLRNARLQGANLTQAIFDNANLGEANLESAILSGVTLQNADLTRAHLKDVKGWHDIRVITLANIAGVFDPPDGFIEWATAHGAVVADSQAEWNSLKAKRNTGATVAVP